MLSWRSRGRLVGKIAEALVKVGALQFGTFTLPDGSESPYYINLRPLPSYPGAYRTVVETVEKMISSKAGRFDSLCGVSTTGVIISSPISISLGKPMVYLKERDQPGDLRRIEGEMRPGWTVLLVDGVVTSGMTLLSAAAAIEQEGGKAKRAAVLIDRLEGGRERLSKAGITLLAVTDIVEVADTLLAMELISEENMKAITKRKGGR